MKLERRAWRINQDLWDEISRYTEKHYLSATSEAIRTLIARGLYSPKDVQIDRYDCTVIPGAKKQTVLLPLALLEHIKNFRFKHHIQTETQAARILILRGLEFEKERDMV